MWELVVIGAGAAGLLAATRAAERGRRVLLLEKNPKPGVKILMSGGRRCNLTNAADRRGILDAFGEQGPFLRSALAALGPSDLVRLIEAEGVRTKVEAAGKVFPASDQAGDVLGALLRRLRRSGAETAWDEPAIDLRLARHTFQVVTPRRTASADRVIITTGGKSHPKCGATGDGYVWAQRLGHALTQPRPALVPVTTHAQWAKALRGVAVGDVVVQVAAADRAPAAKGRGALLFTHFGLSGPVVLDVSRAIPADPDRGQLELVCDFLPVMSACELAKWLRRQSAAAGRKRVAGVIARKIPRALADALVTLAGLPADRRGAELSKPELAAVVQAAKETRIPITGTLGFDKAEVTAGGVSLLEINPQTMESRLRPGLYFAGEVLDLDGPVGGYNLQAAFSTGWLAGDNA
jgi:predicted Rossmann fold flavoprotein